MGGNFSPSGGRPTPKPGGSAGASRPPVQLPGNNTRPTPPSAGLGRPGAGKPTTLPGNVGKPGAGNVGGGKPTTLPGNVGKPGAGNVGGGKPTTLPGNVGKPGAGNVGGGKPTTLPGNVGRPTGKPGDGGLNRPDRPGSGGSGIANRPSFPSIDHRPTPLPGQGGNRPGGNYRPGDRPIIGGGNNNNIIGGGNNIIGGGNTVIGGGNNINVNRPGWGGAPGWGVNPGWNTRPADRWNNNWNNHWNNNWVHHHHHGWYNGCWTGGMWGRYWYAPLAFGATAWGLGAMNAGWGYGAYANPYYVPAVTTGYDYSQPIVINNYVDANAEGGSSQATSDATSTAALTTFDTALEAFKSGDYGSALARCDNALKDQPNDPVIHEVRALCLFATGKYQAAGAALNSLLASAPGMNWTTMSGLYGDADDYTKQLRALESHLKANPKDAAARFVLAYHYLVLDETDAATNELKRVVAEQPKDGTAKRMLEALTGDKGDDPAEKPKPETPDEPQPETDLVGKWTAKSGDTSIELQIGEDSRFTWKAKTPGQDVQEIQGEFATTADTLELTSDDAKQGTMAGEVASLSPHKFSFRFAGAPKSAAPLIFSRSK